VLAAALLQGELVEAQGRSTDDTMHSK